MMTVTMLATMMTGMLFLQMNHPLAMGLMLLMQTAMITLMTGMMSKSFWFSYILFLIFIGGMLVLFIYVTALASNEMFTMSLNMMMSTTAPAIVLISTIYMADMFTINSNTMNIDSLKLSLIKSFHQESSIDLIKLYNHPTNYITIMMMSYLLITLIAVVKITNILQGPLRKLN